MIDKYPKDEEYLDENFPKRDSSRLASNFRGQAMVLLALAREEGKEQARQEILDWIDSERDKCNVYPEGFSAGICLSDLMKKLKVQHD